MSAPSRGDLPSARTLTVEPLAHRRECIDLVKSWFVSEWPSWYGPGGPGNVEQDVNAFAASEDALPVGMLVFEGNQPIGAGALKAESIPTHAHLSPWAAAGYVLPTHRGRGVGAVLLHGIVDKAKQLGFARVYCGTSTANSLLVRAGWSLVETTSLQDKPLGIYRSAAPGAFGAK